jgi:hypothetical protein
MRLDVLLGRDCIPCPAPLCTCSDTEDCVVINRDCDTCYTTQCVPKGSGGSGSGGGVSKGALAGAVVGVLILLGLAVTAFLWYRRRARSRAARTPTPPADIPASAEEVLKRADPMEKRFTAATEMNVVRDYTEGSEDFHQSNAPVTQPLRQSPPTAVNPFEDAISIQTAGSEGTNVIPIALIPPNEVASDTQSQHSQNSTSTYPVRPARSPDVNLNLDHVNVSKDSLRTPPKHALSMKSGISGVSSRHSYMSGASYSSDFLNEAPVIITSNKGAVRQVLGVVKAEVVNAPGSSSGSNSPGILRVPTTKRPAITSPLAATSFGPSDMSEDESQSLSNPFSDGSSSIHATYDPSPGATSTRFDSVRNTQEYDLESPEIPWAGQNGNSRPASMSTQAGSVIDISSATRVRVGGYGPGEGQGGIRSPFRTTMAKLVPTPTEASRMPDQQREARGDADAQAQNAADSHSMRRLSASTTATTKRNSNSDSLLEQFPIVPPSPISNRGVRSPPSSPFSQSTFTSPSGQAINILPPSPLSQDGFDGSSNTTMAPPDRRMLGRSTGSELSVSSGLSQFPFIVEGSSAAAAAPPTPSAAPPSAFKNSIAGRQRASLDTLALTAELTNNPLPSYPDLPGRK